MRKINARDCFKLARILKAADIKDDIVGIFGDNDVNDMSDKDGINMIMTIIMGCSSEDQEKAIFDLLGDLLEKDPEKVASESLQALKEDILEIGKENNLADFFSAASALNQ